MTTIRRASALALAALLGLATATMAQEAQETPSFEGRVEVNEVLLDVLVTDRDGNVVIGLGPEDFRVTENGKDVELADVTFYSNRRFLESAQAAERLGVDQVPENRYFIIFFDDQKVNSTESPQLLAQQLEAGRKAKAWVRTGLLPNDYVAVASFDSKLKIHSDFTRDRKALSDAVDSAVRGRDPKNTWPSRVGTPEGPSLLVNLPKGNALRDETPRIYDALRVLSEAAGNITGRKNLLLFTIGFGELDSFGQYRPDGRYYEPMVQALNDNNVAVYALDLVPPGTNHTMASAMNQIADETGGKYYFNMTSFETPLEQITTENNGYYLLAYKSEHKAGTKGFQEVQVKATNPEFRVRTREGYAYGG